MVFGICSVLVSIDQFQCENSNHHCLAIFIICCRIIFNTLFGLSVNFWMAVLTRLLLGSLNGLLGPVKVCDSNLVPI